jgi:ATP-binding protein involved in chromosome partitioning
MGDCNSCGSKGTCTDKESCSKLFPKYGKIKQVIGVMSGKGGVGKSTVTGILAIELRKAGFKVGVLDGDITGPSMPRFFGVNSKRAEMSQGKNSEEVRFEPIITSTGIKLISLNLLTEEEEQPVIWRGPVITGVLTQMYTDTNWGVLDYLLIDMPPGTGDVALTVMQSLPVDGMVIVATPQNMVTMIVKKNVIMAEKMKVKLVGVVENMCYIKCNNCMENIKVFSKNTGEEQAKILGIPLLMELPIDLDLVESMEAGTAEAYILSSNEYELLLKNFKNNLK